ncbi:8361_t:CDS:2 [Paraglomus brasilianum]|uniref:8361_t:CDS:1 n=1 Tax=Paraglomus brasilianum TaxID=144538 RepID=A0A9N9DN31_9GLOM|nr:8361_t:CDS:2 [Paraglomus brasilianum]
MLQQFLRIKIPVTFADFEQFSKDMICLMNWQTDVLSTARAVNKATTSVMENNNIYITSVDDTPQKKKSNKNQPLPKSPSPDSSPPSSPSPGSKSSGRDLMQPDLEKKVENLSLTDSSDLKDEKQRNIASETKFEADIDLEFTSKLVTNNKLVEGVEKYAERLGIKEYTENKDMWKKFYDVFGPDFVWPPTMKLGERREVLDYIIDPEWEPTGEELARNTIEYRRLLESGTLDASQGSHILIINGKLDSYGNKISPEDDEKLEKKYPGCLYAPVVERTALIRKFLAMDDQTRKEWQSHICIQNVLNSRDEVIMANTEQNFRMVIDIGSTMTIIPNFVRQQLYNPKDGWERLSFSPDGYGDTAKLTQASREWLGVWVTGPIGPTGLEQENCIHGKKSPLMSIVV